MKKRVFFAALTGLALLVTGCGSGNAISNDYIEISKYKGLYVEGVETQEITDEAVEAEIYSILQNLQVEQEITDRPADYNSGDWVTLDYTGVIDGVAFDGGTRADAELHLGSGSMPDGFEQAISGHNVGDQFEFDLTFPESYPQDESKAGQTAHWVVTLKKIAQITTPELTDSLVKEVLAIDGVETVEEYRAYVKERLTANAEATAEYAKQSGAYEAVFSNTTLKSLPEDQVTEQMDQIRSTYEGYAAEMDMTLEEYVTAMGYTMDEFDSELLNSAQSMIIQNLVFDAIAEKEGLVVDDGYYQENKEAFAEKYSFESARQMEELYTTEELMGAMQQERILAFLVDNSVTEPVEDKNLFSSKNLPYLLLALAALEILALAMIVLAILRKTREARQERRAVTKSKREADKGKVKAETAPERVRYMEDPNVFRLDEDDENTV